MISASRPTNRRRTKAEVHRIKAAIVAVLAEDPPMTVRQVFYRLVSAGVIRKSETEYKSTVVRLLTEMRRAKEVPFSWIADNTRWMRKPATHPSLQAALDRTAEAYRRSLWDDQDAYVEIWLEKDALSGVLFPVTARWDVPLMVTRGYPSLSFLHTAAETIQGVGKPTHLYYFGDYDPSGLDITRSVEEGIRELAPRADIGFERVAVTAEQIAQFALPTRPTKATDSRSKGFAGASVEVDAIHPTQLREIVEGCITRHIDPRAWASTRAVEEHERAILKAMALEFAGGRDDEDDQDSTDDDPAW